MGNKINLLMRGLGKDLKNNSNVTNSLKPRVKSGNSSVDQQVDGGYAAGLFNKPPTAMSKCTVEFPKPDLEFDQTYKKHQKKMAPLAQFTKSWSSVLARKQIVTDLLKSKDCKKAIKLLFTEGNKVISEAEINGFLLTIQSETDHTKIDKALGNFFSQAPSPQEKALEEEISHQSKSSQIKLRKKLGLPPLQE